MKHTTITLTVASALAALIVPFALEASAATTSDPADPCRIVKQLRDEDATMRPMYLSSALIEAFEAEQKAVCCVIADDPPAESPATQQQFPRRGR
jgi:hypothetical protein